MASGGCRPAEAAASLGVPPSTLRLYSVRFARLLSESAAAPVERGGGKPGYRLYSEHDLTVLREGKDLLGQGLTYDQALRELRRRWAPHASRAGRPPAARQRVVPAPGPAESDDAEVGEAEPESPSVQAGSGSGLPTRAQMTGAPAGRDTEWALLATNLLASLGSAQAVGEEWRRIVEERNVEIGTLRQHVERLEGERRRSWWRRLFGG